jgi:hypothetical protein
VEISGCGDGGPQEETVNWPLKNAEGGPIDAGADCFAACAEVFTSFDMEKCAFVFFEAGNGVSCSYKSTPTCYGLGRRPASLLESGAAAASGVLGDHFAQAARLEAASARAFRVLARELAFHSAPSSLVRAARRSAVEEGHHARATRRLARRFGATPLRARYGATLPVRTVEGIATENAIEGCIRETYGAAIAWWQARQAGDRRIARAMARIAADETRHANLSWDIAAWAEQRLTPAARERVERAKANAVAALRAEIDREVAPDLVKTAGIPARATARELLRRLDRELLGGARISTTG